ncbi:hypothetical protein [Carnobacterium maltaromaticum]|uniref:hypothetical protein n=1 Tax=Carnobacterium maltaromaticum TaxID=2751 RepID=UPI0012FA2B52|nr:hypothetical protein [Carnobacterium maltaromaticum]
MNDALDHDSKNFLHRIIENILKKLVDSVIEEIKRNNDAEKFLWDKEELARQCCMSVPEVEKKIVSDRRMKIIERRKGKGKLYWQAEKAKKVIPIIMDEWD